MRSNDNNDSRIGLPPETILAACLTLAILAAGGTRVEANGQGESAKPESVDATLLVDSFDDLFKKLDHSSIRTFDALLKDPNVVEFGSRVESRYPEASLTRILASSPDVKARRAAALASALTANFRTSNTAVAKGLRDGDPTVRFFTEKALWAIWFRASTSDNNKTLEEVSGLIGQQAFDAAIDKATKLIEKAPDFAEAYNQRAIAYWQKGELAKSIEDCLKVLDRNPYHFGALTGMAGCYRGLGQPRKMLSVLRRAQRVRPHDAGIAAAIRSLEQELGPDSGKSNSEGIEA